MGSDRRSLVRRDLGGIRGGGRMDDMKRGGYIQPTPETAAMWRQLADAKARGDRNEMARLTEAIRTVTIRNGQRPSKRTGNVGIERMADTGEV